MALGRASFAILLLVGQIGMAAEYPKSLGALGDSGTAGVLAHLERSKLWNPLYHLRVGLNFIPMLWSGGKVEALTARQLSWSTGFDPSGRVLSLAAQIQKQSPGLKVKNVALPSIKTPELLTKELPSLHRWSVDELNQNWPDLVTLFIGANDLCADTLAKMTSLSDYSAAMREILNEILLHSERTRVLLLAMPRFETFWQNNKDARAVGWLGSPWVGNCQEIWKTAPMCKTLTQILPANGENRALIRKRIADYNQVLEALAEEWGGRVILMRSMAKKEILPQHLAIDCFHPNHRMHAEVAEEAWSVLRSALEN